MTEQYLIDKINDLERQIIELKSFLTSEDITDNRPDNELVSHEHDQYLTSVDTDAPFDEFAYQSPVIDKDLTAPPGGESTGDRYIVAASATGSWAGQDNNIAEYNGSSYDFYTPVEGWMVWVKDEDLFYVFTGTVWEELNHYRVEISEYVDFTEISAPADPGAGVERLYAADEGGHAFLHTVDDSGVDIEISRDNVHVVRNNSGANMSKGDVVHISGGNGNFPTVVLADANGTSTTPAHGVLLEDVNNNAQGLMLSAGDLNNIDLQSFTEGDIVYLSETAGDFTATKPSFPSFQQEIGVVVKNTAAGILAVFVTDSNKLLDEDTMSSNSADFGATQQSIKAYVDTRLAIGESNAQWASCSLSIFDTTKAFDHSTVVGQLEPNTTGMWIFFSLPLPLTLGSLDLYVKDMQIYVFAADASNYINRHILRRAGGSGTTSDIDDNTNYTTSGYTTATGISPGVSLSGYSYVGVAVQATIATPGNLRIGIPEIQYYYA